MSGYNEEKVKDLRKLDHDQLAEVLGQLLEHLGLEVHTDSTPDYVSVILREKEESNG